MSDGQAPSRRGRRLAPDAATSAPARVAGVRTQRPHSIRFAEDAPLIPSVAAATSHGWKPSDYPRSAVVARADGVYPDDSPYADPVAAAPWPSSALSQRTTMALDANIAQRRFHYAPLRPMSVRDCAFIAPANVTTPPNAAFPLPSALPGYGAGVEAARRARPGWMGGPLPKVAKPLHRPRTRDKAGLPSREDDD